MKRKHKQHWQKQSLRLRDDHTWKAPKGYKIMVIDRGLVSFNIPDTWHIAKFEPLELNDRKPPNDNARLTVSCWRLPPGIDWTGLPLAQLLEDSTRIDDVDILERGEIIQPKRDDLELAWTQHRFMDPKEHREAFSRIALAREPKVQALFTFDYWVDDAAKFVPAWDEVLRSLQMGRYIEDPTRGVVLH